jgi:hypothetical protein
MAPVDLLVGALNSFPPEEYKYEFKLVHLKN